MLPPAASPFMQKHFKSDHRSQRRLLNEARRHCNSSPLSAERHSSMLINEPRSGTQQEWAAIICNAVLPGISEWRSQGRQSALITMKEQTFDLCSASPFALCLSLWGNVPIQQGLVLPCLALFRSWLLLRVYKYATSSELAMMNSLDYKPIASLLSVQQIN